MRNHGILLTVISAVLLIVLCIGAMGLSDIFLSDYQDVVEEITLSENQSMLMINNRESTTLSPWDIYERVKSKPVISTRYEDLYSDKEIERIIEILSPWVINGYETVEWNKRMRYTDTGEGLMFYIKDVQITDEYDYAYRVNIALTDDRLIYYSCDRINTETSISDIVVPAYEGRENHYDMIVDAYDTLNNDYSTFLELYKSDDIWNGSGDSEIVGNDVLSYKFDGEDNCFALFLDKLNALEDTDAEQGDYMSEYDVTLSMYSEVFDFLTADTTTGMIYRHSDDTPDVVNVEFSSGGNSLVLFYDLLTCEITGFSIQRATR